MNFATFASASPVIVCGNPRSGTRMHANVLNTHPDVLITDEYHDIKKMRALLSEYRKNNLLKKFGRERALARQAFIAKMMWLACSIDRVADRVFTTRIIGNKTPQIENSYVILENVFSGAPPKYVYCLRSAPKVLRSVKNLPNLRWNRDSVATNLDRYLKSVRCMEEMQASFPNRICVSIIDHLRPGTPNSVFFEPVFRFLDLEMTAALRVDLDAMGAQNTMEAVKKAAGIDSGMAVELTGEEMDLILGSPEYREIRNRYDLDPALT